jgi:hypothetical protein
MQNNDECRTMIPKRTSPKSRPLEPQTPNPEPLNPKTKTSEPEEAMPRTTVKTQNLLKGQVSDVVAPTEDEREVKF